MPWLRRTTLQIGCAALTLTAALTTSFVPSPAMPVSPADTRGEAVKAKVRVDGLGYLPHESKRARLMTRRVLTRPARFEVTDRTGRVVLRGTVPEQSVGRWNARYPAVYVLRFSGLTERGAYRIRLRGGVDAVSPEFLVTGRQHLYGTLLNYGISFDQMQRDGDDVIPGSLNRQPSHLRDASATVYRWPHMVRGSDLITDRDLTAIGGPVDVEGGWFDAGDYLKFTHSTAYNDVLLFTAARMLGKRAPDGLLGEAHHGLDWLDKMWHARTGRLYIQVGIGSGNRAGTFYGDHDRWRLPETDDTNDAHRERYLSRRPVFAAAPRGHRISPNLVGRVSAAFALAAQLDAKDHPARARRELRQARRLYRRAAVQHPPKQLVTALPHAFYPEDTWRDDMELGATEIALAMRATGKRPGHYVREAARWARGYVRHESGDTFNLYDTSALAHTDLIRALRLVPRGSTATSRAALVADLRRQLRGGARHARRDPFAAGAPYDEFDVNSHTFGMVATAAWYRLTTGRHDFDRFATRQRGWLLGTNPWGVSAMVGVGTRFPRCMQHQVANLSGSTDGSPPLDVGAVVNGPNGKELFEGLGGFQDGMVRCPDHKTGLRRFDGHGSRYLDDARAWQSNEPALDMTGAAIIAAAAELALRRRR